MSTRSSWSSDDVRRGEAKNERTIVGGRFDALRADFDATNAAALAPPPSFEALFLQHYETIRLAVERHAAEPGWPARATRTGARSRSPRCAAPSAATTSSASSPRRGTRSRRTSR